MPPIQPPVALAGRSAQQIIPPGTLFWRVHSHQICADEFIVGGKVESGGRFDALDASYPSMYVSFQQVTAVAERLLRRRRFTSAGKRTLPPSKLAGIMLSAARTTTELTLLRLVSGQDFLTLRQSNEWLVTAGECDYPRTRRWAAWLRDQLDIAGIVWKLTEEIPNQTAAFFGDRCPPGSVQAVAGSSIELDDAEGAH